MPQTYAVCPWPVDTACFDDAWEGDFDEPLKTRAIALASATLQRLTAYRVSNCTILLRPCTYSLGCSSVVPRYAYWAGRYDNHDGILNPYDWDGVWYNACGCGTPCGHTYLNTVWLPKPMGGVVKVKVDGAVLVAGTDYRVDGSALIALGSRTWPLTQDLTKPDTASGTFSIEFYNSVKPDGNAAYACALLAMQYARACAGKSCDLPKSVTSVVRQGVTYTLPSGSFPNGETGIREVDAFIALYNPQHRLQTPQAYVP